ncbi:serine/threonine protein kinase [Westiellopsis prolifica IICB1]|nr:serine/threonine protein kinase [Westiellopsis prolifica IICB1]
MSYCINPNCPNPENLAYSQRCQSCGSRLLLRSRYRVVKALGQGGFGATFLANDQGLPGEPSCVIKQLRPSGTAPRVLQMARELFEREAVTLGKIGNHPQVPRLLDYFEEREQFYLVQEYISGCTLQQEVKHTGVFTEAGVKQFLSEILPLLEYIHQCKVIHRDIKPANVIRRVQDSRLVLIDFGAVSNQVRQAVINHSEDTALTAYAIGTPGFAPPEQMAMRPVYASDIYALGITCIYLLTSKSPKNLQYNPTTGELLWENHVQVSDHLADVLRKMLEVSVRNRYQTAAEVLRGLELEPYLESLSKSLVSQPNDSLKERTIHRLEDSRIFNSNPSSVSNMSLGQVAAAIRARRARMTEGSGATHTRGTRQRMLTRKSTSLSTNSTGSQGEKSQSMRQLDSQNLISAYLKGRRDFALHNLNLLNLQGANLSETNFHSSQLQRANLQGADLHSSDFGRASLNRANLRDSNLTKAYLNNADLEGADLRGADLSYAYLQNANLRGANLCGANLTGAKISEEELAVAKTNWMTVRPNGKRGLF